MPETDATADGLERKLATILSADVAAYSRLMAEDEEHALQTFRGHKEIFEKLVSLHRGRIFNTAGDAILAEFASAVEAVRCATEIQAALRTRNDQILEERRVQFRIGVVAVRGYSDHRNRLAEPANTAALAEKSADEQVRRQTKAERKALRQQAKLSSERRIVAEEPRQQAGAEPQAAGAQQARLAEPKGIEDEAPRPAETNSQQHVSMLPADPSKVPIPPPAGSPAVAATLPNTGPAIDATGVYRGPICYSAIAAEPARCYRAQAVLTHNRISGEWPGRGPGVTMYLAGEISRSGDVVIHMHGKRADGSHFATGDLVGTLRDGHITANGNFINGRTVTLNWQKN